MNSKTTWRLLGLAVALYLFIYFYEGRRAVSKTAVAASLKLLPNLNPGRAASLDLSWSNQVLRAQKSDEGWSLVSPAYPAQVTAIENFVLTLKDLPRHSTLSAGDVASGGGLKEFGLEPPFATLTLRQESNRFQLNLGSRTPLANQIYVQTPGSAEIHVTDASLLAQFPRSPNDWRSPMLMDLSGIAYDRVQIRAGPRVFELEQDRTNKIWRIAKPIPARANPNRIDQLLHLLREARVSQFVTDQPNPDLDKYGLQAPDAAISFGLDTNTLLSVEFGTPSTNAPNEIYAFRSRNTNIVAVPKELVDFLKLPYKQYHDPRLVSFSPATVDKITVKGGDGFTLQRLTNRLYQITEPAPLPTDPELVAQFFTNFFALEIVDFAKEVPTEPDLKQYRLAPPLSSFSLFSSATNSVGVATNTLLAEVGFGAALLDTVFARRSDETPIYLTRLGDYQTLPLFSWQLRDRRIWNFAGTNVSALVVSNKGRTVRIPRNPATGWTSDPIQNAVIDETLHQIGQSKALAWVGKGGKRLKELGLAEEAFGLDIEFSRSGAPEKVSLSFGKGTIRGNVYAAVFLDGETEKTIFEFPGAHFRSLIGNLAPAIQGE